MDSTLLLNADARPISYLPLSTKSWKQIVVSVYLGNVSVLHYYDNWTVRSPSIEMRVPAVAILKQQVSVRKRTRMKAYPSDDMIFLRDAYTCQYCDKVFARHHLTLDHVMPKSYGGTSRWDNLTTACATCNHDRGHDTDIQPKNAPYQPTHGQLLDNLRALTINIPHESWSYYLGWAQEKIKIIPPFEENIESNFDNSSSRRLSYESKIALTRRFEHV